MREGWRDAAACKGMPIEIFFPSRGELLSEAQEVCGRCPVAEQCGAYAETYTGCYGIWGGRSGADRRRDITATLRTLGIKKRSDAR